MHVSTNTLTNDQDLASCFVTGAKADEIGNYNGFKRCPISHVFSGSYFPLLPCAIKIFGLKNPKSSRTCFRVPYVPVIALVPSRFSCQKPKVLSHMLSVDHLFPLLHPCEVKFVFSAPKSQKSYLTCFQWTIFFPCCTPVK